MNEPVSPLTREFLAWISSRPGPTRRPWRRGGPRALGIPYGRMHSSTVSSSSKMQWMSPRWLLRRGAEAYSTENHDRATDANGPASRISDCPWIDSNRDIH